jgi:exosortase C (VPDSG-CTERM-specific)
MNPEPGNKPVKAWFAYLAALTLLFGQPLAALAIHAYSRDLHSHILLVPFITGYLIYVKRGSLPAPGRRSAIGLVGCAGIGMAAAAAGIVWRSQLSPNDYLAFMAAAYVAFVAAGGFLFMGTAWMRGVAFPMAFLLFMIPLPDALVNVLEQASMLASAEAAAAYFRIAGTPLVRNGTVFELPGIVLQVAQECSGIRSSWVLVITSLLAAHLFLDSPWRKLVLVAFVIPLGILRNGFRVFVIGLLCVHIGPQMISSVIHRRGGPLFFALSLVPLFLLLWWLRRGEQRGRRVR